MHFKATIRRTGRSASSAGTALATVLLVGAGVAAIAQPLERPRQLGAQAEPTLASLAVRPATVRIALAPPAARKHRSTGTLRMALDELGPAAPAAPEPVSLAAAKPEKAAPLSMAPARIAPRVPIGPAEAAEKLAVARGKDVAAYSAAVQEIATSRKPEPIPMVDAESRAAVARMNGIPDFAASVGDRTVAFVPPAPARADSGADVGPSRMVGVEPNAGRRLSTGIVALEVTAKIDGASAGRVSLMIRDSENISVRMNDLLAALETATDKAIYERLKELHDGRSYLTFNELRGAGLSVRFDNRDRLMLETR